MTANGLTDMFDWLVELPGLNHDKFMLYRANLNCLTYRPVNWKRTKDSTGPKDRMGPTADGGRRLLDLTPLQLACQMGDLGCSGTCSGATQPAVGMGPGDRVPDHPRRDRLAQRRRRQRHPGNVPAWEVQGVEADAGAAPRRLHGRLPLPALREKWKKLRFVHYTTTSISVFYFVSLVATALAGRSSRGVGTVWTVTLLCALVLHVGETMRETIIYVRRYANANAKKKPMLDKFKSVLSKLRLHGNRTFAHFKLMSFALTIGALARRAVAPPPEVGGGDLAAMVLFVLSILVLPCSTCCASSSCCRRACTSWRRCARRST